jgi:VanZ family protein
MAAIFFVSSLEQPPAPTDVPDVDLHGLAYFGLMLVVLRAVAGGRWAGVTLGTLAIAWLITVAYGATDEWHQLYVPQRQAEIRDWYADAIGACVGGIAAKAWSIIRRL